MNEFMNDFWKNISRYPRFFIASLFGLILVILAPLKNILQLKQSKIFLPVSLILILLVFLFYITLKEMTASY
jgi:uncharacterized membrane protein